jgi:hypothetical protein
MDCHYPSPADVFARQITTVEQLDAVPIGGVVRSELGSIACRFDETRGVVFGDDRPFPWQALSRPALLLWHPNWRTP